MHNINYHEANGQKGGHKVYNERIHTQSVWHISNWWSINYQGAHSSKREQVIAIWNFFLQFFFTRAMARGGRAPKKTVNLKTLSKFLTNLFLTKCWSYYLPLPTKFFDKNHDILGFEFTFTISLITFWGSGVQTERHRVPWLGQIE